ncbi:lactate utilization protein [soil metagenome]
MTRDDFLARIAGALGRSGSDVVAPPPEPPSAAVVSPSTAELDDEGSLVLRFVERASAVGAIVRRVRGESEALACAAAVVREYGLSACVADDDRARSILELSQVAAAPPAEADVGVSTAWRAVAETGTVVVRAEEGRLVGVLPSVHVVVLRERDVRRGLVELYRDLATPALDALPSSLVQITGPSRTADIEMTLTTGVPGPGTVVVVLVATADARNERSPE